MLIDFIENAAEFYAPCQKDPTYVFVVKDTVQRGRDMSPCHL